jgi:hypothetical protein
LQRENQDICLARTGSHQKHGIAKKNNNMNFNQDYDILNVVNPLPIYSLIAWFKRINVGNVPNGRIAW